MSFKKWADKNAPIPGAWLAGDEYSEKQRFRQGAKRAWSHQQERINQLEKDLEENVSYLREIIDGQNKDYDKLEKENTELRAVVDKLKGMK